MADIDDTARKTDAGTKLLNRHPSGSGGRSRGAKAAETNKPTESTFQAPGLIDDAARTTDAGTKLLNRQPAQKARKDEKKPSTKEVRREPYLYPGATGQNVWAFRPDAGYWVLYGANGWDVSVGIPRLQDLLDGLKKRGLGGQVSKLAIVAHGNADGVVQLESLMTPTTLGSFKPRLLELGLYLKLYGKLMFVSCLAGRGPQGTALLTEISKILPGIYVIGFEILGGMAPERSEPGQVWEALDETTKYRPPPRNLVWLNEHSYYSKWALNGRVIKLPHGDRINREKKKCANPTCPGHPNAVQQCDIFP
jgi:hypothetical protein